MSLLATDMRPADVPRCQNRPHQVVVVILIDDRELCAIGSVAGSRVYVCTKGTRRRTNGMQNNRGDRVSVDCTTRRVLGVYANGFVCVKFVLI